MRSNGLTASAYTPVADLEPPVADTLLADLRVQGVAAYTKPVESTSTTGFDRPEFRVGVKVRLFVDTTASRQVRQLIASQGCDLGVDNDDLAWAQIVATFDQPVPPGPAVWPAVEDVDDPTRDGGDPPGATAARLDAGPSTGTPRGDVRSDEDDDAGGRRDRRRGDRWAHDKPTDDSDMADHFVPAIPPPLPKLDASKQLAWLGLAGGPLLLLFAALFAVPLPTWLAFLAVAGFVGGFLTLVVTLDDRGGDDRGSDDGAVV